MVEQDEKVGALPAFNRLTGTWEGAGWISRLWWVPILALAMALRFYGLTSAAIWGDEGSSLLLSEYAATDLWFHAAHDVHPPLYFFLLRGWIELFGDSIWSIRSMSAIPGVAAVGLGIWLTRQLSTRRAAVLAGILLALLPTAVRYSQEVRMYSLLGVWLLGATLALVYWVRSPERTRYLAAYVVLMSAGFYTHYFTAQCIGWDARQHKTLRQLLFKLLAQRVSKLVPLFASGRKEFEVIGHPSLPGQASRGSAIG